MTDRRKIDGLCDLLGTVLSVEKSKMAALLVQEEQLMDRLAALTVAPSNALEPAQIAGADVRYQMWAEQRRREINIELARLRCQIELARVALSKAFGREQAAASMRSDYIAQLAIRKNRQTS